MHKAFGVPTIVLDGGDGPHMFGPIISEVPDDDAAVDLWRHFAWVARNPNLAEINLTFPKPSGSSFTLSIFMEDGDHCGDYASAQYTFPVAGGQPGSGTAQGGGVSLEE